jgi:hypothetical protein
MTRGRADLAATAWDFKSLADVALARRRNRQLSFVHVPSLDTDPRVVLARIRSSSLADLVLPEGASLSVPDGGDYYPDLGVTATDASLRSVSLMALGWDWPVAAGYPDNPTWSRVLEISGWYGPKSQSAVKQVFRASVSGNATSAGDAHVSRDVWASEYAETGYEGHNQSYRDAKVAEIAFFVALFAELAGKEGPS